MVAKRMPKRVSLKFLCILCATLVLSACSYFDKAETVDVEKPYIPTKIDLTVGRAQDQATAAQIYGQRDGSVQVFDFGIEGYQLSERQFRTVSSSDPSVQIFALDDEMFKLTPPRNRSVLGAIPVAPVEAVFVDDGQVVADLVPDVSINPAQAVNKEVLYFDHASSNINGSGNAMLDSVARSLKNAPATLLSVEGHANSEAPVDDPVKRKMVNLKMSMDRAYSVVRGLVDRGVRPEAIRTVAWGETRPQGAADAETNRRVEIIPQ